MQGLCHTYTAATRLHIRIKINTDVLLVHSTSMMFLLEFNRKLIT